MAEHELRPTSLELRTAKRHLPSSRVPSQPEPRRPFSFDRPLHAAIAHFTMGVSPAALMQTYTDWLVHLMLSPDKRAELAVRAGLQWMRYFEYCLRASIDPRMELLHRSVAAG